MLIRFAGLLLVMVLILGCSGGDGPEDATDATPRATSAMTPRPGSTAEPNETPKPTIAIDTFAPRLQLTGVFRPPQETEPTHFVELEPRPKTEYAAWDGVSVVIYDTETGEAHNLGPGSLAQPAFGGGKFVYTSAENQVMLVDLETMKREEIGRGLLAYFLGDAYVVVNPGNNRFYALNLETGKRVELSDINEPVLKSMVEQRWGGDFLARYQDERFAIRPAANPHATCESSGVEQRACLADTSSKWLIEDVWAQEVVLAFEANKVATAGPTEVVIATTPVCYEAGWMTDCYDVLARLEAQSSASGSPQSVEGTSNIFLVNLVTGEATFIATTTYNASTGKWPMNWPLVADERFIAWTESYCGDPQGSTRIYNRETGEITQLNRAEWLVLSKGRLGFGEQGSKTILDAGTLEYLAVLPDLMGVNWSRDLRYAAVGQGFGRGSVCE